MTSKKFNLFVLVIIVAALSILASRHDNRLAFFGGGDGDRRDNLSKVRSVFAFIDKLYVDEVDWDAAKTGAINGALETLDPHSVYISKEQAELNQEEFEGRYQGIGIQFDVIEGYITVISVIPGSPSEEVGLQSGDKIIKINGESAYDISISEVPKKLKGRKGTNVTVTIRRPGVAESFDVDITRGEIPIFTVNTYFMVDDSTGYIWLNRFASTTAQEVEDALTELEGQGMKRLLFDLRSNGGGYLQEAVKLVGKFIPGHKKVVYTRGRLSRFNNEFYTDDFGQSEVRDYSLVILIDYGSASASEIVAGAIQDYDRGLIAGTNSFGKGLVQNEFELRDNSRLRLTVSKYYTPSGRLIQKPYEGKERTEYYYGFDPLDADSAVHAPAEGDSAEAERPVYHTEAGRIVYGGGGITPDVEIKYESGSESPDMMRHFFQKRIFFETASAYAAKHPELENDFAYFLNKFSISEKLLRQMKQKAKEKGVQFEAQDFTRDIPFLKNRLKAEIARILWGMEKYYQVLLQRDNQYEQALELFPEAKKIMIMEQTSS